MSWAEIRKHADEQLKKQHESLHGLLVYGFNVKLEKKMKDNGDYYEDKKLTARAFIGGKNRAVRIPKDITCLDGLKHVICKYIKKNNLEQTLKDKGVKLDFDPET